MTVLILVLTMCGSPHYLVIHSDQVLHGYWRDIQYDPIAVQYLYEQISQGAQKVTLELSPLLGGVCA